MSLTICECGDKDAEAGLTLSSAAIQYDPDEMKEYEKGFRSYISLKKREIRKKINRLNMLGRAAGAYYFLWETSESVVLFEKCTNRILKIKAIYESQLTELDKQLNG